jgi:hypothetical protein
MKKLVGTLISVALLSFAHVGTALGVRVIIDPADYTGQWTVDYGPAQRGAAIVDLAKVDSVLNAHVISISGAEILFNVSSDGSVTVQNRAAATGGRGKLTFNTTVVKVDPVFFTGNWRISAGATPNLIGEQTVTLIPGLDFYNLEVGATGGFVFHIGRDGTVVVPNGLAASGSDRTLTLRNTERFQQSAAR